MTKQQAEFLSHWNALAFLRRELLALVDLSGVEEIEVTENRTPLGPFWRLDRGAVRPPTSAELRAVRPRARGGRKGRASRRACNTRTRGSRRAPRARAPSGDDPPSESEPPGERRLLIEGWL